MTASSADRTVAAHAGALNLFAFFHLNLAYSSIEEEQRGVVIAKCYWPLLTLAERCGPIGIEASAFTLEEIASRDPRWIAEVRRLIDLGKVEFIGCGYSQMIGPLVPWKVTAANLRIGNAVYQSLLGQRPRIALINEQAYSGGLVELYCEAGYDTIIMDWDNPNSTHDWPTETGFRRQRALGPDGSSIGLLWSNTVAFQKLQRYAHSDIPLDDYLAYIRRQRGKADRALCIYASDAEIFDFRPGRYKTEEKIGATSEWLKLEEALLRLKNEPGCVLVRPSDIPQSDGAPLRLETPDVPIPVKKQPKYNLSRWAVTGKDDLFINGACEKIYRALDAAKADDSDWKELCYLWASDFRTHITTKRWAGLSDRIAAALQRYAIAEAPPHSAPQGAFREERLIDIVTPTLTAQIDRRRGLALTEVRFQGDKALIGVLPHGTFDEISLQADWYTGNAVFEAPGEHKVTDLEWARTQVWQENGDTFVYGRIDTPKGPIEKTLRFHASEPRIDFDIAFHWDDWGKGSLRLGHISFKPDAFDWSTLTLKTHNGGKTAETFSLAGQTVEHGAPVSFLVSASHGLGMTEGWAEIGDGAHTIRVTVDRATAPLLGLLTHKRLRGGQFCQLALSALELDDTRKPASLTKGPRRVRFSVNTSFPSASC